MKILCVIPSRIASTRLPSKPLLLLQGKPLVQWVYENASRCKVINEVIVATDNEKIVALIERLGGKAVMTDPALQTGTDRVAAVAEKFPDYDVVINLQGDEPFVKPRMLEQLVAPYVQGENPAMTTLAYPISMEEEYTNPGVVKVITDQEGYALYFSRAPIPYFRQQVTAPVFHHIGLYAFRRDFLMQYPRLSQTPLEKAESLEQLRAMEHGYRIKVCLTQERTLEINTPEELQAAEHFVYLED